MTSRSRRNNGGLLNDAMRQNPLNFQCEDPTDLYVKDTEYAGYGLFASRFFSKGEFIINYRGEKTHETDNTIYVFDTGRPENIKIDATHTTDCMARYINDIDCFKAQNCHPVKRHNDEGEVMVTFFATRNVEKDEELRYAYNCSFAPWRKQSFFRNKCQNPQIESKPTASVSSIEKSENRTSKFNTTANVTSDGNSEIQIHTSLDSTSTKNDSDSTVRLNPVDKSENGTSKINTTANVTSDGNSEIQVHNSMDSTSTKNDSDSNDSDSTVQINPTENVSIFDETSIAREESVSTTVLNNNDISFGSEVFEPLAAGSQTDLNSMQHVLNDTHNSIDGPVSESSYSDTGGDSSDEERSDAEPTGEHEETLWATRKSFKTKRPEIEKCLICNKNVKKMRDHMSNAHRLGDEPRVKKFLGTYYSTLSTKRCYQCLVCLTRMSYNGTHPKHHKLQRIFNREDIQLFPMEVQITLRRLKESLAKPYENIVQQFNSYMQSLADDGAIVSVSKMSATLKVFIGQVILQTKEFSLTTELAACVRKFKIDHSLKRITIAGYLIKLKKFIDFVEVHAIDSFPNIKKYPWEKVLAEVRTRYQSAAQKEKRQKSKELYAKVPTLKEVQEINFLVQDFLNSDLSERVLHYKELSTLNVLVLSFRLNCRAGPLLHLTWEDVNVIKKVGSLETDAHKTGKYYDVTIQIQSDQMKWLKRLKSRFVKEFRMVPTLVVASPTNKVEHSMSKNIRAVLSRKRFPRHRCPENVGHAFSQ